jgi:hypothetical protein
MQQTGLKVPLLIATRRHLTEKRRGPYYPL